MTIRGESQSTLTDGAIRAIERGEPIVTYEVRCQVMNDGTWSINATPESWQIIIGTLLSHDASGVAEQFYKGFDAALKPLGGSLTMPDA